MSELPMVSSIGWRSVVNFTGLNGSMRPRPQSGRLAIQALVSRSSRTARRVPGMIANRYSSRSNSESCVFFAISPSNVLAVKRGSDAQAMRNRRYSCSPVWCEAAAG
jgi:hypothetical protein